MSSSSVFQAYCYNHPCQVRIGREGQIRTASLVTISRRSARILVDEPGTLPAPGDTAALTPKFLDGVLIPDIESRIEAVSGREMQLYFSEPLSMPGARLCQLTRR